MDSKAKALVAASAALAAILLLRRPASAAEYEYEVTFTVLDNETEGPLQGARITILGQAAITNASGMAVIGLQASGIYEFSVALAGYDTFIGAFEAS